MKIGILTFHKAYNYGAFLQAYSLQNALNTRFDNDQFELIDYVPANEVFRYWIKVPMWILIHQGFRPAIRQLQKYKSFSRSWKKFDLSKSAGISRRLLNKRMNSYDFVIVGSDAVFNDNDLTGFSGVSPFFLEKSKAKKCSYAASAHGLDFMSFDMNKRNRIKNCLNDFQLLSVRDTHTELFVKEMLEKDFDCRVFHSCDPTILLGDFDESEFVKELISNCRKKHKHVVALMLKTEDYSDLVKACIGNDTIFISLANSNRNADVQLLNATPFEWATCLKYVDYTVTDYFHGTLVSLRMGKPVISIDISSQKNGNKTKIEDLLIDRLMLPQFYFNSNDFNKFKIDRIAKQCKLNFEHDYSCEIHNALEREKACFFDFCNKFERLISL